MIEFEIRRDPEEHEHREPRAPWNAKRSRVGELVYRARVAREQSPLDVARLVGAHVSTVRQWEASIDDPRRPASVPSPEHLGRLSWALRIDRGDLEAAAAADRKELRR